MSYKFNNNYLICLITFIVLSSCQTNNSMIGIWVEEKYKKEQLEFTNNEMIISYLDNNKHNPIKFKYTSVSDSANIKIIKVEVYREGKLEQVRMAKIEIFNENKIKLSALNNNSIKPTIYVKK